MNPLVPYVESNDLAALEQELRARAVSSDDLDEAAYFAARLGRAEHLARLIRGGAYTGCKPPESGWSLLHVAVEFNRLHVAWILVESGLDVDIRDYTGLTPLLLAVDCAGDAAFPTGKGLDLSMIRLLLELGANPLARDNSGDTPVGLAARYKCPEMITLLAAYAHGQDRSDG